MPETPEELYRRSAGALRTPAVEEWDSWPFEGELRPRTLRPPLPFPQHLPITVKGQWPFPLLPALLQCRRTRHRTRLTSQYL